MANSRIRGVLIAALLLGAIPAAAQTPDGERAILFTVKWDASGASIEKVERKEVPIPLQNLRRMYAFSLADPGEVVPFIEAAERQDRPVLVARREWVVSALRIGLARRASL